MTNWETQEWNVSGNSPHFGASVARICRNCPAYQRILGSTIQSKLAIQLEERGFYALGPETRVTVARQLYTNFVANV